MVLFEINYMAKWSGLCNGQWELSSRISNKKSLTEHKIWIRDTVDQESQYGVGLGSSLGLACVFFVVEKDVDRDF